MPNRDPQSHPPAPAGQQAERPARAAEPRARGRRRRFCLLACWCLGGLAGWFAPDVGGQISVRQARACLTARDAARSLWWLDVATTLVGKSGEERFLRARANRKLGRLDATRSLLVEAAQLGCPQERLEREQWLVLAQAGQLREAEPHLARLLTDPQGDGPDICEAYVNGFFVNHRLSEAYRLLDAWAADYPQDPQPHFFRGQMLLGQQRAAEAESSYREALARQPRFPAATYGLAQSLREQSRVEEAIPYYTAVLKAAEHAVAARVGLAGCWTSLGRSSEARQLLQEARRMQPADPAVLQELARIELHAGNLAEAVTLLESAVARDARDSELRYVLATALARAGRPAEAKPHFQYVNEARIALSEAQRLTDHLAARPDDVEARFTVGRIHLQYGSREKGLQWLRSVLNYDANHQPTRALLAEHYALRRSQVSTPAGLAETERNLGGAAAARSEQPAVAAP